MTFVDHLRNTDPEKRYLEVAFGRHIIEGDLGKSILTGSSPNHVVTIQQFLGDGLGKGWKGVVGAWFRGFNRPAAKFKFYPGKKSNGDNDPVQGVDSIFDKDIPHSNTAWIRLECPSGSEIGIPDFDTKNNPPIGFYGIFDCQTGDIYDALGNVSESDVLLINPADVIAFGCKEIRGYLNARIDFGSLEILRSHCDQTEIPDYTQLPEGVGLTGKYFNGTNFNTFVSQRVDPIVQFDSTSGAPALDLNVDSFSARWEGKIRPKYTQTYTFYVTHDNGARLFVNGLAILDHAVTWNDAGTSTPGTHSGTIDLIADQYYDIKLEFNEGGSVAYIKLEWQSTSQPREVVPQDRLYPKAEPVPKFRSHIAFTVPANFDNFLRQVLFSCNGTFQDVDGKYVFFTLDGRERTFDFNESNIKKNTFSYQPRFSQQELLNLPNRFIADGRDLDSQYLEKFDPQLFYDVEWLQEIAGRIIEETVVVGTTTRWQGRKNLAHYAKLKTSPLICEFEGMPQTFPVLPGDVVSVTHSIAQWNEKQFLTLEATDKSIGNAPDERIFKLLEWETK